MNPAQLAIVAKAFALARWRMHRLRNRAAIQRHAERSLRRAIDAAAAHLPFYRDCAGAPLAALPVTDKALLLDRFADMNRGRLDAATVKAALARGEERIGPWIVGQSTGTSGTRGVYVISEAERFQWLGTLLAKALPDALWRRQRVALAMPGLSALYRSASQGSRIALRFFDLNACIDRWAEAFREFAADSVVAPPRLLRVLAERGMLAPGTQVFSGAEVLDPLDRTAIEAVAGRPVREIYMATEGLFAVACRFGTLHLAEDVVHVEWQAVAPGSPALTPLVTDFTRRAQALLRYRMNDLIELDDRPCPCGCAFQPLRRIHGRSDDLFQLADSQGRPRMVTPDVLRNALVDAHPAIRDFRILQQAPDRIAVTLEAGLPAEADAAVLRALQQALARMDLTPTITLSRGIDMAMDGKLRRVRRVRF